MRWLSAFLISCLFLPTCWAQGTRTIPPAARVAPQSLYRKSHALLIGVSEYVNHPRLNMGSARSDAEGLAKELESDYGFKPENVAVVTGKDASLGRIRTELANLARRDACGPLDQVVIYFACHAKPLGSSADDSDGYLLPSDANVNLSDPNDASGYLATCLAMSDLQTLIRHCPAAHVLLIADCCYSGFLSSRGEPLSGGSIESYLSAPARQVMTAGKSGELAWDDPYHGLFTRRLLSVLKQRAAERTGPFTVADMFGEIEKGVSNDTAGQQHPQLGRLGASEGEVLFAPGGVFVPAPAPAPADTSEAKFSDLGVILGSDRAFLAERGDLTVVPSTDPRLALPNLRWEVRLYRNDPLLGTVNWGTITAFTRDEVLRRLKVYQNYLSGSTFRGPIAGDGTLTLTLDVREGATLKQPQLVRDMAKADWEDMDIIQRLGAQITQEFESLEVDREALSRDFADMEALHPSPDVMNRVAACRAKLNDAETSDLLLRKALSSLISRTLDTQRRLINLKVLQDGDMNEVQEPLVALKKGLDEFERELASYGVDIEALKKYAADIRKAIKA